MRASLVLACLAAAPVLVPAVADADPLRLVSTSTIAPSSTPDCVDGGQEHTPVLAPDPSRPGRVVAVLTVGASAAHVAAVSRDGGRSWGPTSGVVGGLSSCGGGGGQADSVVDPDVAVGADGRTWLSTGTSTGGSTRRERAVVDDGALRFGAPAEVVAGTGAERGFLALDPDQPGSALALSEGLADGSPAPLQTPLLLSHSEDHGATWQTITLDTPQVGHDLLAMGLVRSQGAVLAFDADVDVSSQLPTILAGGLPAGTLRVRRSTDGGLTFSAPAVVAALPQCCLPSAPKAAGRYVVAPLAAGPAVRLARSTDGGRTFAVTQVAAEPSPLPPAVAVDADGRVAAQWYDATDPHQQRGRFAAASADGPFDPPVTLGHPFDASALTTAADAGPLGPFEAVAAVPHGFLTALALGGENAAQGAGTDVVAFAFSDEHPAGGKVPRARQPQRRARRACRRGRAGHRCRVRRHAAAKATRAG